MILHSEDRCVTTNPMHPAHESQWENSETKAAVCGIETEISLSIYSGGLIRGESNMLRTVDRINSTLEI